ncbi:hypothetical protein GCM10010512_47310 [Streptomyces thermoviolaceus subsp. thermoviolaceus]|nr:hypothetical protein GCM10010499_42790 [Streptomyces thermoviolaceus subsp. apingens]GHB10362.1 hypothetical protein GCM10010512_47310 [Streptomyces thermoviolaceus subsp. thermoviolaceus]
MVPGPRSCGAQPSPAQMLNPVTALRRKSYGPAPARPHTGAHDGVTYASAPTARRRCTPARRPGPNPCRLGARLP